MSANGAWITLSNKEYFINRSSFFTDLQAIRDLENGIVKEVSFVDENDKILARLKKSDYKLNSDFTAGYYSACSCYEYEQ
ncbi:hypothetical protein [Helicobacter rodentium]|uniref:hypothetical protein n=1 Tax=Helicobacter rodentium TaxID=59617 RepID=UPI0023572A81|nr:hypothetical protein [Helicobacter rodentium]